MKTQKNTDRNRENKTDRNNESKIHVDRKK